MKYNELFLFTSNLDIPGLGFLSVSFHETWILGFVSMSLFSLFIYTIRLMGEKPVKLVQDYPDESYSLIYNEVLENDNSCITPIINSREHTANFSNESVYFDLNPSLESDKFRGFQKEQFNCNILAPMVKNFLKELPHKSKIDHVIFAICQENNFYEFIIQSGKLFIDCDCKLIREESITIQNLLESKYLISNNGKKITLPISTPSKVYGFLCLESSSEFSDKEALIFEANCIRFAFEWESKLAYELATLDTLTSVYNINHFHTILKEKFLSREILGLFLLDIKSTDNCEEFITYLAEFYQFPIYRLEETRIAFFLNEQEIESIGITMQNAIQELDRLNFYTEFLLAYSIRKSSMYSVIDWEEDAFRQLKLARKKSSLLQVSTT